MKHLVALLIPICIFSFLAFGVSCALLGTNPNYNKNTITGRTTVITDTYSEIEVSSDAANVRIYPTNTNTTTVISEQEISETLKVNVDDGTLKIDCDAGAGFFTNPFDFIGSLFNGDKRTVTIYVPDKLYSSIKANINAGTTEIVDVATKDIDLNMSAGTLSYAQPAGTTSDSIDITMNAGTCNLYNADTKNYSIEMNAGTLEVYGLTGTGDIDVNAGTGRINYADLNGNISAELAAGSVELNLPEGANANVHCEKSAGSVDVKYGNINTSMKDGSNVTIGEGTYAISTDVSAGSILISDKIKTKEAPTVPEVTAESDDSNNVATTAIHATSMPVPEDDTNVKVDVGDIRV